MGDAENVFRSLPRQQSQSEGRRVTVARTHGVGHLQVRTGPVPTAARRPQETAPSPSRQGYSPQIESLGQPRQQSLVVVRRPTEQVCEYRQLLVVQLQHSGQCQGLDDHLPRPKPLAEIDVEDAQGLRPSRLQHAPDGLAGHRVALGQCPEAHRISASRDSQNLWPGLQKVPGNVGVDGVSGLPRWIEGHAHGPGGRDWIDGDPGGRETQSIQALKEIPTQIVTAHARDHERLSAERMRMVGEVGGRSAQLTPTRQEVPKNFPEADAKVAAGSGVHGRVGLAGNAGRAGETEPGGVTTFRAVQADCSS